MKTLTRNNELSVLSKPQQIPNLKVTKSNELVEAGYKVTLNEQRLLLMAIAQIDSRRGGVNRDNYFIINASEYAQCFGMDIKNAYRALNIASDRLYDRDIKTYDKNNNVKERFRWVFHIKYQEKRGHVELGFSPNAIKHLTGLSKRFTSYELKQVTELESQYSIRLYELLMQFANHPKKVLIIDLEKFRLRLDLVDRYPRYFDLNKRVITPSMDEINKYTNINVRCETKRKGRVVTTLEFYLDQSVQQELL